MPKYVAILFLFAVGCSSDEAPGTDTGVSDGGMDAGRDFESDLSSDANVDAQIGDSGPDAADSSNDVRAREGLRVMSYNLRYANSDRDAWDMRKAILVNSILKSDPDLLGVQEADEPWMPYLIEALGTTYDFVGVGRDDGEMAGEYAAIFYKKEVFELMNTGNFWLSETPEEPSFGWGATNRRICTFATFKIIASGEVIAHFNTHLDHQSELAREEGAALIVERIAQQPYPTLLTGDFNFRERSTVYRSIEEAGLKDSKQLADESMPYGTINYNFPVDTGIVIDFVFVQEDFDIYRYQVDPSASFPDSDRPVSDHFPVIVDFDLR